MFSFRQRHSDRPAQVLIKQCGALLQHSQCCSFNPAQGPEAVLTLVGESVRAELLEILPALHLGIRLHSALDLW